MIVDTLDQLRKYSVMNPEFAKVADFLEKNPDLQVGKYEINGDKSFAMVSEYDAKEVGVWEAHRKYVDIQTVLLGEENFGFAPLKNMKTSESYNLDKDIEFFEGEGEYLHLQKGKMLILFPWDAHKPGMIGKQKTKIRKLVIKVAHKDN